MIFEFRAPDYIGIEYLDAWVESLRKNAVQEIRKNMYMYVYLRIAPQWLENESYAYDFWNQRSWLHRNRLSWTLASCQVEWKSRKNPTKKPFFPSWISQIALEWEFHTHPRISLKTLWNHNPQRKKGISKISRYNLMADGLIGLHVYKMVYILDAILSFSKPSLGIFGDF